MNCLRHTIFLVSLVLLSACANRGMGPQGGPKDETPPEILKEVPFNGSTDFHGQEVVLYCNEYIQLNNVANQVIISPPSQKQPIVKGVGKRVIVTFGEPLRDSTTYNIDFGSAICDYNERNPMKNYSFSFSTGPVIDTLQLSGTLINAEDLNPVSGITIGLHYVLHDSAFNSMPFAYIARTDEKGAFCVKNVKEGRYRIYALNDISKDYIYQPSEALAFLDTVFSPIVTEEQDTIGPNLTLSDSIGPNLTLSDTIGPNLTLSDSIGPNLTFSDSIGPNRSTKLRYEPQDILLRLFSENKQRRYFQRPLRDERHLLTLLFAAPQDSMPGLQWLPIHTTDSLGHTDTIQVSDTMLVVQPSHKFDTINIWLTDSLLIRQDTLSLLMTYMFTDSTFNLVPQTDTIEAVYREPRMSDKAREALEKKRREQKLELKSNTSTTFDIYQPLTLTFATPLKSWQPDSLHFYEKVDTVRRPLPFTIIKADSTNMKLLLMHDWQPEREYELEIDSAAFTDVYHLSSDRQSLRWKIRSLDEYATLIMKVEPFNPRLMLQVLTDKDVVVHTLPATEDGTRFEYLKPQTYYIRAFEDLNGDSVWTTGDWEMKRQPEPVYYSGKKQSLRANWDFEETFLWQEKALLEQKPAELKKDAGKKK